MEATIHLDSGTMLDLVHGLLPDGPSEVALAHLQGCPACEGVFQLLSAKRERIRAGRQPRLSADGTLTLAARTEPTEPGVHLAAAHRGRDARGDQNPWRAAVETARSLRELLWGATGGTRGRRLRWAVPAAIAVAALAVILLVPAKLDRAGPSWPILPPLSDDIVLMSAEGSGPPGCLEAGMQAYQRRDFAEAVRLLQQVNVARGHEEYRDVFLGNALAHNGQHREAVAVLERALGQALPDPYDAEGYWTLYLCLYSLGENSAADSLLNFLRSAGPGGSRDRALKGAP